MTDQLWTSNGSDIWRVIGTKTVLVLKNLDTGDQCSCPEGDMEGFWPVHMPKIKAKPSKEKIKKKAKKTSKPSSSRSGKKSKYKGVSKLGNKWRAQCWSGEQSRNIHLGSFDSDLLAAACYQEHMGNKKEADRLRQEYAEGDGLPVDDRPKVKTGMDPGDYMG